MSICLPPVTELLSASHVMPLKIKDILNDNNDLSEYVTLTSDQISPSLLDQFLRRFYPGKKCDFLLQHGNWLHKEPQNRWVIASRNEIAAYCAVIPTQIWVGGTLQDSYWWVDLIIAPEHRGRGFQSIFDKRVVGLPGIKLGFPNTTAAKIHRKHGWGVREDLSAMLLPFHPRRLNIVRRSKGIAGTAAKCSAFMLEAVMKMVRRFILSWKCKSSQVISSPDPDVFAKIFERNNVSNIQTTNRSKEFLNWRYFDSPFFRDYDFYISGPMQSPSHYLIARNMNRDGISSTRILDLYGDFRDGAGIRDIIKLAVRNSLFKGSSQISVMVTLPEVKSVFRRLGFFLYAPSRFCWQADMPDIKKGLAGQIYLTLADSDNDEPE